jgi:crotonobetainyl-CoA:carnitine CoA-transferase CaiB-like acyl-CoA transferase
MSYGPLSGIRVLEIADEQAEYCGLLLAGLGATVLKVEPPEGGPTRRIGPFFEDVPGPERSLYFWAYNRGKQSVVLDAETRAGASRLAALLAGTDVVLESTPRGTFERWGIDREQLVASPRSPVVARVTPFGDDGPWAGYKASDLIHLALGGPMMNCGYDPLPDGRYDLPPIAGQSWQAFHIAGDQVAVAVAAALFHRQRTGRGQLLSCAIHDAVSKCTEADLMSWVMLRQPVYRQTCRHAQATVSAGTTISDTKDGRWVMLMAVSDRDRSLVAKFLRGFGMGSELPDLEPEHVSRERAVPGTRPMAPGLERAYEAWQQFVRKHTLADFPWREAQRQGLLCAPVARGHETVLDEHWWRRGTFAEIEHPAVGRSFVYPVSKWLSDRGAWNGGAPAPRIGAHRANGTPTPVVPVPHDQPPRKLSRHGKPYALEGIRVLDFTWFLASAGATRFLAAFGAECIKVEWKENPDTRVAAMAPVGGRAAREAAVAPLKSVSDTDMGGQFNNKNPGKRGLSLNVRDPQGIEIARRLVAISDVVAEGFSPGVMERWGLGYDGDPADAFDVVVPSLPGFGFSSPLTRAGINFWRTADLWVKLMQEVLGYEHFAAHGGNWGGDRHLATRPQACRQADRDPPDYTRDALVLRGGATLDRRALAGRRNAGGPRCLGCGGRMGAPPRGPHGRQQHRAADARIRAGRLASRALRMVARAPSRLERLPRDVEQVFTPEELLTAVTIYWVTRTFGTSVRWYLEAARDRWRPYHDRSPLVEASAGVTIFTAGMPPGSSFRVAE